MIRAPASSSPAGPLFYFFRVEKSFLSGCQSTSCLKLQNNRSTGFSHSVNFPSMQVHISTDFIRCNISVIYFLVSFIILRFSGRSFTQRLFKYRVPLFSASVNQGVFCSGPLSRPLLDAAQLQDSRQIDLQPFVSGRMRGPTPNTCQCLFTLRRCRDLTIPHIKWFFHYPIKQCSSSRTGQYRVMVLPCINIRDSFLL